MFVMSKSSHSLRHKTNFHNFVSDSTLKNYAALGFSPPQAEACPTFYRYGIMGFTRGYLLSIRTFFRLFAHVQMLPILESGEETLVGGQAVM